jgi:hypothetical protein
MAYDVAEAILHLAREKEPRVRLVYIPVSMPNGGPDANGKTYAVELSLDATGHHHTVTYQFLEFRGRSASSAWCELVLGEEQLSRVEQRSLLRTACTRHMGARQEAATNLLHSEHWGDEASGGVDALERQPSSMTDLILELCLSRARCVLRTVQTCRPVTLDVMPEKNTQTR